MPIGKAQTTSQLKSGDLALLGLPADDKSSYLRGAAAAPAAIRAAYACPSTNTSAEDGSDLELLSNLVDLGDLPLAGRLDMAVIEAAVAEALGRGARLLCLGGDHAVSYPVLSGYLRSRAKPIDVLHLDAHNDLYEDFEGDRLSHACPFARACEEGAIGRLVQVGIRGMTPHLRAQAERFGVEVIDMRSWGSGARPGFPGEFYLSLDLDALDPAFAPGVSHHEPGGLSTREALALVQSCPGTLVGADLVELNPGRDPSGVTVMVAAKFLKEILSRFARGGAPL
jgi:agmatinase